MTGEGHTGTRSISPSHSPGPVVPQSCLCLGSEQPSDSCRVLGTASFYRAGFRIMEPFYIITNKIKFKKQSLKI